MSTYFISDIHLHANSKVQAEMLFEFLQTKGKTADAIYILGDLFAIWLGDDLNEPYAQDLIHELKALKQSGVPVYFMRGNRDFLAGRRFCQASGTTLLTDPCKIVLYGHEILLTHGDQMCTLDIRYQKFRSIVQNPVLDFIFLCLPISWRKYLGRIISRKSRGSPQNPATYDVVEATAQTWFQRFDVTMMIHGHTHRPNVHTNNTTTRIVLGDWLPTSAKILKFDANQYQLLDLAT